MGQVGRIGDAGEAEAAGLALDGVRIRDEATAAASAIDCAGVGDGKSGSADLRKAVALNVGSGARGRVAEALESGFGLPAIDGGRIRKAEVPL
jgi:hypothetical protein